jgi:hypothetical protein
LLTPIYSLSITAYYVYSSVMQFRLREGNVIRVFTEIRRHGIPYLLFTPVHSVYGTELAKILRKYTEFRVAEFCTVARKFAKFRLCNCEFFLK